MRIGFRGFGVAPKSITDAPPVAVACSAQGPRTTTCSKICADKTSASRSRAWIGMPQFVAVGLEGNATIRGCGAGATLPTPERRCSGPCARRAARGGARSEEHTSELQSLAYLVCRLLLEKKKKKQSNSS